MSIPARAATVLSVASAHVAAGVLVGDVAWWLAGRNALPGLIAVGLIMITALAMFARQGRDLDA